MYTRRTRHPQGLRGSPPGCEPPPLALPTSSDRLCPPNLVIHYNAILYTYTYTCAYVYVYYIHHIHVIIYIYIYIIICIICRASVRTRERRSGQIAGSFFCVRTKWPADRSTHGVTKGHKVDTATNQPCQAGCVLAIPGWDDLSSSPSAAARCAAAA